MTLTAGGMFGVGPGAGSHKFRLPEPHTDYIFSVIGEEFGLIACLAIAILYFAIVARVLIKLLHEEDSFLVLAAAGLVCQFRSEEHTSELQSPMRISYAVFCLKTK